MAAKSCKSRRGRIGRRHKKSRVNHTIDATTVTCQQPDLEEQDTPKKGKRHSIFSQRRRIGVRKRRVRNKSTNSASCTANLALCKDVDDDHTYAKDPSEKDRFKYPEQEVYDSDQFFQTCLDTVESDNQHYEEGIEYFVVADRVYPHAEDEDTDEMIRKRDKHMYEQLRNKCATELFHCAGFTCMVSSPHVRYVRLLEQGNGFPTVQICFSVNKKFRPEILVYGAIIGHHLNHIWSELKTSCFTVEDVKQCLQSLNRFHVCPGNPDSQYQDLMSVNPHFDVNAGTTLAAFRHLSNGSTIRSTRCSYLIKTIRCKKCSLYRNALTKCLWRQNEREKNLENDSIERQGQIVKLTVNQIKNKLKYLVPRKTDADLTCSAEEDDGIKDFFKELYVELTMVVKKPFILMKYKDDNIKIIEVDETSVKLCINIKRDLSVHLYVYNKLVPGTHPIFNDLFKQQVRSADIELLLQKLELGHVCIGNPEQDVISIFQETCKLNEGMWLGKQFCKPYLENDFATVYGNPSFNASVRAEDCQLLVPRSSDRCESCKRVQDEFQLWEKYRKQQALNNARIEEVLCRKRPYLKRNVQTESNEPDQMPLQLDNDQLQAFKKPKSNGGFKQTPESETNKTRNITQKKPRPRITCKVCGRSVSWEYRKAHHRSHTGEKPYLCESCGSHFSTQSMLTRHKYTCGSDSSLRAKQHLCEICGESYLYGSRLKIHMRIHTGERPFECDVCGKRLISKLKLKIHKRIHSEVKRYKCDVCGRGFGLKNNLRLHTERKHTDLKPYQCTICGRRFGARIDLTIHNRRIHLHILPYLCKTCGQRFQNKLHLDKHKLSHLSDK